MTQPGRRSAAAMAVFPIARHPPPAPPEHLPEEAKAIWHRIVVGFRADRQRYQGATIFELGRNAYHADAGGQSLLEIHENFGPGETALAN